MVVAVLHPQDVLAPSQQGHPNCRLSMASECASAAALATPVSVCHGILGRPSFGATETRGVLSRRDSSAGLLPLPDHVPQSTLTSLQKSSTKFASVRRHGSNRGPLLKPDKNSSFLDSTYEHVVPLQRRSIFDLDRVSQGRRRPACEDHAVVPARLPLNSTHCGMPSPSMSVPDEVLAHPRIASIGHTSLPHLCNPALSKRSEQPEATLLSEATYLGSRVGKGGAMRSNDASTLGRTYEGSRLLKRSASEKIQERTKLSAFTRPRNREVAEKFSSAFQPVHYQSRGEYGRQQGLSACPAAPMQRDTNAPLLRGFLGPSLKEGKLKLLHHQLAGVERPSASKWCQYTTCAVRSGGQEPSYTLGQHLAGKKESGNGSLAAAGWDDAPQGHASHLPGELEDKLTVCDMGKANYRPEDALECLDVASDTNGWLSMVGEPWAGPSFFNSPPPSALPVPTFTSKLLRSTSTSPEPINGADCGSSLSMNAPVPEVKRTWDAALVTRDLRRLLHLDHGSCDA